MIQSISTQLSACFCSNSKVICRSFVLVPCLLVDRPPSGKEVLESNLGRSLGLLSIGQRVLQHAVLQPENITCLRFRSQRSRSRRFNGHDCGNFHVMGCFAMLLSRFISNSINNLRSNQRGCLGLEALGITCIRQSFPVNKLHSFILHQDTTFPQLEVNFSFTRTGRRLCDAGLLFLLFSFAMQCHFTADNHFNHSHSQLDQLPFQWLVLSLRLHQILNRVSRWRFSFTTMHAASYRRSNNHVHVLEGDMAL